MKEGQVPVWAKVGFRVAFNWPVKEPEPMTVNWLGATVVPMPMLPKAVRVPPILTLPDIEATPTSSKAVSGDEVLMPTLLLVVSTLKTLVSTSKSLLNDKTAKVEAPETVKVSETRCVGLRVRGPIPVVLVGGSWKMVGTCLEKESKLDVKALTLCSRASRSMMRVLRLTEEAETEGMKLFIILVSVFLTLGF